MSVSVIEQAKIQAQVLVPLVKALQAELGEARANAIVRKALGDLYRGFGEQFWKAHRAHYYQRMVRSGFGHRNTALLGYILMLSSGVSAMWAMHQDIAVQLGVGVIWGGIYLSMMIVSERYLEPSPGD